MEEQLDVSVGVFSHPGHIKKATCLLYGVFVL